MRVFAIALSLVLLGSFEAGAQQAAPAPPEAYMEHLSPGNVAAVGAGALIGVFGLEALGIEGAALIGGVGGSIIGAWWYASSGDEIVPHVNFRTTALPAADAPRAQLVSIR
jgi:hypothetical protein